MPNTKSQDQVPKRPQRPRSAPRRGSPPHEDGDDAGAVEYEDLFSTPALAASDGAEADRPDEVWGDDDGEPVTIPNLRLTAFPPERELYADAFRAAYRYPDALMLVMQGVRKGLERGKKAAEQAGGQDR